MHLIRREIASVGLLGVVLAGFGPFGTFEAPLGERLVYWTGVLLVSYAFFRPALRLSDALTSQGSPGRVIGRVIAVASVSVPLTIVVWLASFLHTPSLWPSMRHFAGMYVSVLFVGTVMVGLLRVLQQWPSSSDRIGHQPAEPPADPVEHRKVADRRPRFFTRLPPHLRGELLALEVEDHYVRAHAPQGNALLLMRLSDAIAELDDYPGAQVHRSWWVASHAVREVQGASRSRRLVLTNGLAVPVARAREYVVDQLLGEADLKAA
jgi:hypothetical protein